MTLLDVIESQEAKERGMRQAAESNAEVLKIARGVASDLGRAGNRVTIDDVKDVLHTMGLDPEALGNGAGSVFQQGWERVGFKPSERPAARGRIISVWRAK